MDSLDDAIATDGQNTPTITGSIDPESPSQAPVIDPDDPIGGLLAGMESLAKIFQERDLSSWRDYPVLRILPRSRAPACELAALEGLGEPVQSVISVGAALDGLWGVMWRRMSTSSHDRTHAASMQPVGRATTHLGEAIADTSTSPGRDIVLSRLSLQSFHRGSSFPQTAVPDMRTLSLMAATNANLLHVIPIIDPDCFQRLSPSSELRSCWDSLHSLLASDLMGKANDLRWTMKEAQARWLEYEKKIIMPPTRVDPRFRLLVLCVIIVLIHILYELFLDPAFDLVLTSIHTGALISFVRAVFIGPASVYDVQYDVAAAICTIREQLDRVVDAFEEPLRVLTDIVDVEHNSETAPSIVDTAQKDRALLDFMLNFDLTTGGRIQRHCQGIRSKLEDIIEERQVEHRHRSLLLAVYEYFTSPESSSVGPAPDESALPRNSV